MIYVTLISPDECAAKMDISPHDLERLRLANEAPRWVTLDGNTFYVVEQTDVDIAPRKRTRRKASSSPAASTITLMDFYAEGVAGA